MVSALIATPKVWPSGAACATACVPMMVPPPGRLSTTTGWPHSSASRAAMGRTMASVAPPASSGEISLTARVGRKADWAAAGRTRPPAATAATPTRSRRRKIGKQGDIEHSVTRVGLILMYR